MYSILHVDIFCFSVHRPIDIATQSPTFHFWGEHKIGRSYFDHQPLTGNSPSYFSPSISPTHTGNVPNHLQTKRADKRP